MCNTEEGGSLTAPVRMKHIFSTDAGVQYGGETPLWRWMCRAEAFYQYRRKCAVQDYKTAQGVIGGCIYLGQ